MASFILLFIGLILIFCEFYLPGGVMGTMGAVVLIGSIIVFAIDYQSLLLTVFYAFAVIVVTALLFRFALWKIRSAEPGHSIYLESDQEGYTASAFDKESIGKIGVVVTDLKPGGYIKIEGKKHLAISQTGYLAQGTEVQVIRGEGESLIVKHYKGTETS